ncbi:hypothetical protein [Actinomadura latina]|uniref:Uncharacterized protein n=1 Tax=Actinomadura latina TaxID=163603 RepID=A0A846Z658_9ACTN|nr:hypothetical protein [Actinomadura latina]NKZ06244.1 hypothetical protein [Actinomadura latina]
MPVTHGSASETSDLTGSFSWTRLTPRELDVFELPAGTVLNEAVDRARTEHDDPHPVGAGFDNRV